ncbi:hypothetical protein PoB_006411500 [Plakobranchus ocellatus]|uniref:Uncharacterized protein n=1 Tax=Plakobranchus ocellatus TaxID=259542 RepID=A0AAV4D0L8_9GAST|nr:hypothetical protein PoB_006411500 [Plakobranchus ocellatus]
MLCKPLLMFRAIELLCNVSQPWCKEEQAIQKIEQGYRGVFQARESTKFYYQIFSEPKWELCFDGSFFIRAKNFQVGKTNCKHVPDGKSYKIRRSQCPPDPKEGSFRLCDTHLPLHPLGYVDFEYLSCHGKKRKPYREVKSYDIYFLQRDQEYLHTTLCKPHSMFPTLVLLCKASQPLCIQEKVLQHVELWYRRRYQIHDNVKFYHQVFSAPKFTVCVKGPSWTIKFNDFKVGKTECTQVPATNTTFEYRRSKCPPDPQEKKFKQCNALIRLETLGRLSFVSLTCGKTVMKTEI